MNLYMRIHGGSRASLWGVVAIFAWAMTVIGLNLVWHIDVPSIWMWGVTILIMLATVALKFRKHRFS